MADKICYFEGCDKAVNARGLCTGHYGQLRAGRELLELRPRRSRAPIRAAATRRDPTIRDARDCKRCPVCAKWLREGDFGLNSATPDGLYSCCRSCKRITRLLYAYNLTLCEYGAMLDAQGGVCALCRQPDSSGRALAVDHDHTCCAASSSSCGKCVRQLLCWECNTGIGKLRDDPQVLRAAADYIERHAASRLT